MTRSTFEAWKELLALSRESIDVGSFYWTLRGSDIGVDDPSQKEGVEILEELKKKANILRVLWSTPDGVPPGGRGCPPIQFLPWNVLIPLASLAPSGWGRSGGQHGSAGRVKFFELGSSNKDSPPSAPTPPPAPEAHSLGLSETSVVVPAESPSTRDKVRLWVRESAEEFLASYGPLINGEHGASQRNVLEELASAVNALRGSDVA
ncbi:unnamed protein product, partial [Cyprideis torosa]